VIGSVQPHAGQVDARTLSAVFSNYTRCPECRGSGAIRVHYDPGCPAIRGEHFHRECPCGHTWAERSAGHARSDIVAGDDPRFVLLCQHCGARVPDAQAMTPRCCRRPEVHYHDTTEPCEAVREVRGVTGDVGR
jgi:hypothetical protein